MKKIIFSQIIALLLFKSLIAQTISFDKLYGDSCNSFTYAIEDIDSGYVAVGGVNACGVDTGDFYIVKTNLWGDTLWTRNFDFSYEEFYTKIFQHPDSTYLICGFTNRKIGDLGDRYLAKLDKNGNILWQQSYPDSGWAAYENVVQLNNSDYLACGFVGDTASFSSWLYVPHLDKISNSGSLIWSKDYRNNLYEADILNVFSLSNGKIMTFGISVSYRQAFLMKLDSLGNHLWHKRYFNDSIYTEYEPSFCAQTYDNGYAFALRRKFNQGPINKDIVFVKTNSSGDTLWTRTFDFTSNDSPSFVAETNDHGFVITGLIGNFSDTSDIFLMKTDSLGNMTWIKTFGNLTDVDLGSSVHQTSDGGYLISGYTYLNYQPGTGVYTLKARLIKLDENGNLTSINELPNKNFSEILIFPNPASTEITISNFNFQPEDEIIFMDVLGKTLFNKKISAPTVNCKLQIVNFSSGIYFLQLKTKVGYWNKKVVVKH